MVNIHHATPINPYINYPFIEHKAMKEYIGKARGKGLRVKIYNTVRELSNSAYEMFPLRSLGHEIFSPGKALGYAWLQEHLGDSYIAAWYVPEIRDAAVVNSGMSRWRNYYVEDELADAKSRYRRHLPRRCGLRPHDHETGQAVYPAKQSPRLH